MKFKANINVLLWVGIWLLLSSVELPGVRIAGEDGVTSVAPEPRQPAKKPAPTVVKEPAHPQKKVITKKKIIQRGKVSRKQGENLRVIMSN